MDGDFILAPGEEYQQCPYSLAHRITNARFIVHLDKCRRNYIKSMKETGMKVEMVECKFNHLHRMPEPELKYHEEHQCQDQYRVVEHMQYHQSDKFRSTLEAEKKRKAAEAEEREREERRYRREESSKGSMSHSSSSRDKDREHRKRHSKKHKESRPSVEENPWGSDAEDWEAESKGYEAGYDPSEKLEKDVYLYHPRGLSKSERKAFRKEQKLKAEKLRSPSPEVVDVKPFSRLEMNEPWNSKDRDFDRHGSSSSGNAYGTSANKPKPIPPPIIKPEPVQWNNDEKEDGEVSEEEFYGEDPFAI